MIFSDISHKYYEWYFEIVMLRQIWNTTSGIYAKYHAQIMLLAELSRAQSGAPWVRKFGKLSIRENVVIT